MLSVVDRSTFKGKRDYAILVLLWSNALRRSEVAKATISDFDPIAGTLKIYGKGRGNQTELVSLGKGTISAISDWLEARAETNKEAALFCSANPGYRGGLRTYAIYKIVREAAAIAGITKIMSPHRIGHSSIAAALDATNGDVRSVQKLSRHSSLNTLLIYDDNRQNAQQKVTNLLDGFI
jgi:integrase/recombinase XerC